MKKVILAAALAFAATAASAQDGFGDAPQAQQQAQQPAPQQQPQAYPPQQGQYAQPQGQYPQPQQPQWGAQPQQQGGVDLDQLAAMERQDFGVQPTSQLHAGAMHGPTPASIPGGQVITTKGVVDLVQGRQTPFIVLDILGGPETLPGATYAVPAHQAGSFSDQTQQQFGGFLQQATGGNKEIPLILYCQSTQCWMSYNASLRAINLGYKNVLWYRGGVEAWKAAGQPTANAQQQQQ